MRRKLSIGLVVLILLLLAPFIVKAATDGEVDIYAMVFNLEARVDRLEAEKEELQDRVAELEDDTETAITEEGHQEEYREDDVESLGATKEPATKEPASKEPTTAEEPRDEESEPVSPYKGLSLSGVHVATMDGKVAFGQWEIIIDDEFDKIETESLGAVDGIIICYTEAERQAIENTLTQKDLSYMVRKLGVDPLLVEMVKGKTFGSRSEAIAYIESKINE